MNPDNRGSLGEQREAVLGQLQQHRRQLAARLRTVAEAGGEYPRSHTMRLLSQQPALLLNVLSRLAGARWAGAALTLAGVLRVLVTAIAARPQPRALAPPQRPIDAPPH